MNPLEIALIIIGIIIIIISCRLVDRTPKVTTQTVGNTFALENSITEEDKKQLTDKVDKLLSGVSEEVIIRTDDTLSKLSNEKIMAVNEFSDQILEKINRNHEEVIFLYNMLNDKEKEIKSTVKEIDSSKKKVQDSMDDKAKSDNPGVQKKAKSQAPVKPVTQAGQSEKSLNVTDNPKDIAKEAPVLDNVGSNNNSQILALYAKGISVMEISKLLGLGQGEVKLVIDLFKGKK